MELPPGSQPASQTGHMARSRGQGWGGGPGLAAELGNRSCSHSPPGLGQASPGRRDLTAGGLAAGGGARVERGRQR